MLKNRRAKLEQFFAKHALDALLVSNLLNIRYLCGFSGSEGILLLTRGYAWLLVDSRYTTQAAAETSETEVKQFSDKFEALSTLLDEQNLARLGFESAHTTVAAFGQLSDKLPGRELVAVGAELDLIRACKDSGEIEHLESVAKLASESLLSVLAMVRPGVREADIALELEFEMRRRGASGRSFDFIVASGERGAMPHGRASDKIIAAGDLVTIDYGAVLDGYCSDETVTIAAGEPCQRSREIHDIVREAHDRAIAAVRPGIACRELDAVARDFIRDKGYGDFFGHGLGHGVGLEIHEKPVVSPRSDAVVEEGMVFTIEPGIYVPGFGGVRIEDTVVVRDGGCHLLTSVPKELIVIN